MVELLLVGALDVEAGLRADLQRVEVLGLVERSHRHPHAVVVASEPVVQQGDLVLGAGDLEDVVALQLGGLDGELLHGSAFRLRLFSYQAMFFSRRARALTLTSSHLVRTHARSK